MAHSPSPAEFHQDFSSINFDYASTLNTYPAYEIHNMSSPRLGAFNSLNLNNSAIPYYSSSSADGSPSPYVNASPVQSSLTFQPSQPPSTATTTPQAVPSQVSTSTRPFSPSQSISPPLTNLSASDLSADNLAGPAPFTLGIAIGQNHHHQQQQQQQQHHNPQTMPYGRARSMSSGNGSPSSSYNSASGLSAHRSKPYAMPGAIKKRRAAKREDDDDDEDDDDIDGPRDTLPTSEVVVAKRREEIRRQRIESEQRRRDELRDGYRKLKEVLPASNQKSSKVSLLDRATTHIRYLELTTGQMVQKVAELEAETARLRQVNETLMLSAAERSRISNGAF